MKKNTKIIIVFAVVVAIILVWGLIGSSQSAELGITCDFGIGKDGSVFCWKWHTNTVGEIGNAIGNLLNK